MIEKLSVILLIFMIFMVLPAKSQYVADSDFNYHLLKNNNNDLDLFVHESVSDSLLNYASSFLKTPYRRGATGTKSFDCSGFSSFVFRQFGYELPRVSSDQARNGMEVSKDELKKGDLVFFKGRNAKQKRIGHVGIVYDILPDGSFTFIHASCNKGVTITSSNLDYYRKRFVTARRVLDEQVSVPFIYPLNVTLKPLTF